MLAIGKYILPAYILLAPMSGCTDLAFRLIAREHDAAFAFFEMVDSHSVFYHRKKTLSLLKTHDKDRPIALQLLGSKPDIMLKAAEDILSRLKISFLDINAACPAKKVIRKKAGSYLLQDRENLRAIINRLSSALDIPVTVKIRIGYKNETCQDMVDIARMIEDAGASALFVHGRTRLQQYSGDIDYDTIKAVKNSVDIPVFGSGNILSPQHAGKMLAATGCDGILVARGGLGNPWIFRAIAEYISNGKEVASPTLEDKKNVLKKHLSYLETYCDASEKVRVGLMRKVAIWYLKSFPLAKRIREKISVVKSYEKMLEFIDSINEGSLP
ncbi:MAG: tRNA dihydrouridine synthase DusB [Candidatus Omnitrophica bacterium]|nr:tRNA dihydrouridine synthase DusB [Candidatus Omnitrophota bacterium]